MNEAAKSVPATMPAIIGQKRLANASTLGPAKSCHTFVTRDGKINSDAACAGSISVPSTPIATVGRPMPVTPLTVPATKKVNATMATCAGKGEVIGLWEGTKRHHSGEPARDQSVDDFSSALGYN